MKKLPFRKIIYLTIFLFIIIYIGISIYKIKQKAVNFCNNAPEIVNYKELESNADEQGLLFFSDISKTLSLYPEKKEFKTMILSLNPTILYRALWACKLTYNRNGELINKDVFFSDLDNIIKNFDEF